MILFLFYATFVNLNQKLRIMYLSELIKLLDAELSAFSRVRTMKAYVSTQKSVLSLSRQDMELGEVFNPEWLLKYQFYLMRKGLKRNTISFYMRMLRSICNKAIDMGLFVSIPRLFLKVFTGLDPTIKRSVSPGMIYAIARAKLTGTLAFSRDMFMLSFHLQGMAFVDLAYLKKSDIQGMYLVYRRRKTGSLITMKICREAQRILDRYAHLTRNSPYVFPVIVNPQEGETIQYQSALRTQNRRLKRVAGMLGLNVTLSTYVARHSWATMAYHNKVSIALIGEAMGHKTEEVTRIYLKSFGFEQLSQANDAVNKALEREGKKIGKGSLAVKKYCPSLME